MKKRRLHNELVYIPYVKFRDDAHLALLYEILKENNVSVNRCCNCGFPEMEDEDKQLVYDCSRCRRDLCDYCAWETTVIKYSAEKLKFVCFQCTAKK